MELWVRSQDKKTLTKVDNIHIDDEVGNNFCHLISNSIVLGTYNVERAMKIIDEIQKAIEDGVFKERYENHSDCFIGTKIPIYEMPKE